MLKLLDVDLQDLFDFLQGPTPKAWLDYASQNIPALLIDHAHCQRKAAATALLFISKYPGYDDIVSVMSPLAREEMLHFEKVMLLMKQRKIAFCPLKPARYGRELHRHVAIKNGSDRLRDLLIIGAIIEARSCERFYHLMSWLDDEQLISFYKSLVKSESRHFKAYLALANTYGRDLDERISFFLKLENELIERDEDVFRFHSGLPAFSTH